MAVKMDGSGVLNSTLISYITNKRVHCLNAYLDPRLQLRRAASKPGACVLSWLLGLQDKHTPHRYTMQKHQALPDTSGCSPNKMGDL